MTIERFADNIPAWDSLARAYAERFMDLHAYDATYDYLLAKVEAGSRVLEIGCGPGMISRYLLQHDPSLKITATDGSAEMVKLARKNLRGAKVMQLLAADVGGLQGRFHCVVCGFVTPYLDARQCRKLIDDISGILEPGGVFYFSTVHAAETSTENSRTGSGQPLTFTTHSDSDICEWLAGAGFEAVMRFSIPYTYRSGKRERHLVVISRKVR